MRQSASGRPRCSGCREFAGACGGSATLAGAPAQAAIPPGARDIQSFRARVVLRAPRRPEASGASPMTHRKLFVLGTLLCALALLPRAAEAAPVTVGGKASTTGGTSGSASGPEEVGLRAAGEHHRRQRDHGPAAGPGRLRRLSAAGPDRLPVRAPAVQVALGVRADRRPARPRRLAHLPPAGVRPRCVRGLVQPRHGRRLRSRPRLRSKVVPQGSPVPGADRPRGRERRRVVVPVHHRVAPAGPRAHLVDERPRRRRPAHLPAAQPGSSAST